MRFQSVICDGISNGYVEFGTFLASHGLDFWDVGSFWVACVAWSSH